MLVTNNGRLAGPALALGGIFWIVSDVAMIWFGNMTGHRPTDADTSTSFIARLGFFLLVTAYLVVGTGLFGLFRHLDGRARGMSITGLVFTTVAMLIAAAQLVLISGITGTASVNHRLNGLSSIALLVGITLIGFATLRAHTLPQWMSWTVIGVGLLTFPILLVTPFSFAPAYLTDLLGFLLSGIALTIVGMQLFARDRAAAAVALTA